MGNHWTDLPHTHGGTDCGGGDGCPCVDPKPGHEAQRPHEATMIGRK